MNNFKSITTSILFGSVYLIISRFTEKINSNFFDPSGDSNSYLSLAQSIKENGEFVRYEFIQNGFETIRTPLYPLLLSINNLDNLKPFIFVQFLLHCFTALLVFKILLQKTNTKIAYFFSFLFLFNPVLFAQSQLVLTETLSIFLMGLCVFLLFEKKGLIFFTLIISIMPLLRPSYFLTILLIIIFNKVFYQDMKLHKKIFLFSLLLLPSFIWGVRNYHETSLFTLSTLPSMNLLEETASGIKAINEDIENDETISSIVNIEYEERRKWSQILRNEIELGDLSRVIANAPGENPHLIAPSYQRYAISVILEHPLELGVLMIRSAIYIYLEPGDQTFDYVFKIKSHSFISLLIIGLNLIVIIGILGFIKNNLRECRDVHGTIVLYLSLLIPLLLLSTPSARFGSYLIFFNLIYTAIYFYSKKIKFFS